MTDDYFIQPMDTGFQVTLRLKPETNAEFLLNVAPYITREIMAGVCSIDAQGRHYYRFFLGLCIGGLFYEQIVKDGRLVTDQDMIDRDIQEVQDSLMIPFPISKN